MNHNTSVSVCRGFATALGFALLTAGPQARADYPIVSHRYLADPGSLVHDGRIYLYNSNDDDNAVAGDYSMHSIVCVSTSDLKNWTDHGIVFSVPADASWANNSWAPQPIERNGTIFMYFGNSGNGVGVASSTNPTGPFKDAKGGYLVNSSTPGASGTNSWLFDPGALIDDDGQAYLSFGGNGESNARIIKLGSDLASASGSAAGLSPTNFYEASFLFKRASTYYFSYSTNGNARIDYLTSSSPMSGYTYGGIIADQPPVNNNNNHASQFVFNGQWYHAYHNRYVSTQAGISTTYKRNLAIEVLNFDASGKIQQVTYTTDGVPQVGNLDPYVRVQAETTNAQSGIETEVCGEGGMDITNINNGDWIRVRGVDFGTSGSQSFSARVASAAGGGSIELRTGSETGTLIGTCTVAATGGVQKWADTTCSVTGATGVVKDLYLKFSGSSASDLFNLNYWQFTPVGGSTGGTGGSSSIGGGSSTGGTVNVNGGTSSAGGTMPAGGTKATGGTLSTGDGGAKALGGAANVGGTQSMGGASSGSGGAMTMVGGTRSAGSFMSNAGATNANSTGGGATGGSGVTGGTSANATGGATGGSGVAATTANTSVPSNGGSSTAATANQSGTVGNGNDSAGGNVSPGGGTNVNNSTPGDSRDQGGCGCRAAGEGQSAQSLWSMALLGIVLAAYRRRRVN